jgi:hypothetical protein
MPMEWRYITAVKSFITLGPGAVTQDCPCKHHFSSTPLKFRFACSMEYFIFYNIGLESTFGQNFVLRRHKTFCCVTYALHIISWHTSLSITLPYPSQIFEKKSVSLIYFSAQLVFPSFPKILS